MLLSYLLLLSWEIVARARIHKFITRSAEVFDVSDLEDAVELKVDNHSDSAVLVISFDNFVTPSPTKSHHRRRSEAS